jgi:hypothetical protein
MCNRSKNISITYNRSSNNSNNSLGMCCYNNIRENNRSASIDATGNSGKIVDRVLQTILSNTTEMDRLVTRFSMIILIIEYEVQ